MRKTVLHLFMLMMLTGPAIFAIDNLELNSKLDFTSDSLDGRLLTGDDAESGFVPGKPNYVIIYGEGCFNSKRQARRTVELYNKYRSQVHFVVVDLDSSKNWSSSTTRATSLMSSYWTHAANHFTTNPAKWSREWSKRSSRSLSCSEKKKPYRIRIAE